jgi:peptide/nickel transport system ATP-binding protein
VTAPLLEVSDLVVEFPVAGGQRLQAVSGVTFDVEQGETLGLVGETGCGKSTTGRSIVQAPGPTHGSVVFDGVDLTTQSARDLRALRPKLQLVLQDPISALNPRRRVLDIVAEPLDIWQVGDKASRHAKAAEILDAVGLGQDGIDERYPSELSGGQCQRVNIARALVMEPKLLICDEPVSALDVSMQGQILNLLREAKERFALTMVFIGHDLAVVKNISDRVAVMYLGKICEIAPADEMYRAPRHPYTRGLLDSALEPDALLKPGGRAEATPVMAGEIPSPLSPPSGCRFRTRCSRADDRCASEEPQLLEVGPRHQIACHYPIPVPVADAPRLVRKTPTVGA